MTPSETDKAMFGARHLNLAWMHKSWTFQLVAINRDTRVLQTEASAPRKTADARESRGLSPTWDLLLTNRMILTLQASISEKLAIYCLSQYISDKGLGKVLPVTSIFRSGPPLSFLTITIRSPAVITSRRLLQKFPDALHPFSLFSSRISTWELLLFQNATLVKSYSYTPNTWKVHCCSERKC